ncbi:threonine ammonia-lyase [Candidatus Epulonipiscium fishelsonii]|uniref:Threonine ammonia-lyase n=1 Tax=Candidatus Epulonipiscium fishelsonii TaxID=77094 RepID=A0ACC8XAY1_9FIRM|nr:threonine ammonia-lyase [Epulopiscium sp. SCG-B05WGA-EpuloA1]ONI39569.1 threonine ammonia-lyase [Epulopiscium sp. SCG-B11WGA-EpuloA1]
MNEQIEQAYANIKDVVVKTPLLYSQILSETSKNKIYLKCENLQITGAYKLRGALNKIRNLSPDEKHRGVVCASAGNHAQGVAYAASAAKIKSIIVMPKTTPFLKIQSTRGFGGQVVLYGECFDDAYQEAQRIAKEQGITFVHPFDDMDIINGQGTIALEIFDQLQDIDIILCPIGGGGLISGISLYAKSINPNIKIIGVQAAGANAMEKSFKAKKLLGIDSVNTIAEGIAVKTPGTLNFSFISQYVDDVITVTDHSIVDSLLLLMEKHKLVAETSGAASVAAVKKLDCINKKIVCIVSGGNIDMIKISSLVDSGLVSRGRMFGFSVEIPNSPGQLIKVISYLTELGGNIINLDHNQFKAKNKVQNVQVEFTVETNGFDHIQQIKQTLEEHGYFITQQY